MKNIFKIISVFCVFLLVVSCAEDRLPNPEYDKGSFLYFTSKEAVTTAPDPGFRDFVIDFATIAPVGSASEVKLVKTGGTAIEGTDYEILGNGSAQVPAGSSGGSFTVRVYGTNLSMSVPKTAVFGLSSSAVPSASFNSEFTLSMLLKCDSDLAGTYQYSTTNFFVPGAPAVVTTPVTGTVTLTETGEGQYSISDASFGAWPYFYGESALGLGFSDMCNKLSFTGKSQYNDDFTISNVTVNGNNLTFDWTTSYGEYGTTTLVRPTGWPPLH